jgi:hypothetical protein
VGIIVGDLLIGLQAKETDLLDLSLSTANFSDQSIGKKTLLMQ